MTLGPHRSTSRCLVVLAAVTAMAGALLMVLGPVAATGGRAIAERRFETLPFDQALAATCAVVGVAVVAWLWLVAVSSVGAAWRGRVRPTGQGLAGAVRRGVLLACGLTVLTGVAGTSAHAAHPAPPGHEASAHPIAVTAVAAPEHRSGLDGLPFPDRPVGGVQRDDPPPREVVVAAGDSLWSLATALAPSVGTAEAVARAYAANRAVIGSDPDLIVPGQHLTLPRGWSAR